MLKVLLTSFKECASKVCLKGLEISWLRMYCEERDNTTSKEMNNAGELQLTFTS